MASKIIDSCGAAVFQVLDITDATSWNSIVKDTVSSYGKIDVLANNAGISGTNPDRLNIEFWDQQINVNAKGAFLGMRAVAPFMRKAGGGYLL